MSCGRGLVWMCFALSAGLTLLGCASPVHTEPPPSVPDSLVRERLPGELPEAETPGVQPQHVGAAPSDLDAWWVVYGSDELSALVDRALASNPSVEAAAAVLAQSQELAQSQKGSMAPIVQIGAGATRSRVPSFESSPLVSGASVFTLQTAQLTVGYAPDFFGMQRAQVAQSEALADSQAWVLEGARQALAANVVTTAIQVAALDAQIKAAAELVNISSQQTFITRRQLELGAISGASAMAQQANEAQARASKRALEKQRAIAVDQLAVLTGIPPAEISPPSIDLKRLRLPDVPRVVAGELIQRRPDVRAAQSQLRAADAGAAAAAASLWPQVSVSASAGSAALAFSKLLASDASMWGLGAQLVQPLFDAGSSRHRAQAAAEQARQARAGYRAAVLTALQGTADALESLRYDAEIEADAVAQERSARAQLEIAQAQLRSGDLSVLTLLSSESSFQQAVLSRIQATANRLADIAALQLAIGGRTRPAVAALHE